MASPGSHSRRVAGQCAASTRIRTRHSLPASDGATGARNHYVSARLYSCELLHKRLRMPVQSSRIMRARRLRVAKMALDQTAQQHFVKFAQCQIERRPALPALRAQQGAQSDHRRVAARCEVAVLIEYIGYATRHAGGNCGGRAQYHDRPLRHVLATMSPVPSTTAVAPEFLTANRSPATPLKDASPAIAP